MKKLNSRTFQRIILVLALGLVGCKGDRNLSKIAVTDLCSIDNVSGSSGQSPTFIIPVNVDVIFQGWAADGINGRVPKKVTVELVNPKNQVQFIVSGDSGVKREDVAAALKSPSVENAGFSIKTKIQDITFGEYDILVVSTYDEQITVCRSNKKIVIK